MAGLLWLFDEAWAVIAPHRPRGLPGKPRVDDRRVIGGIVPVPKLGCRWRDGPAEDGPATTVDNRSHRWAQRGRWQRLCAQVAASGAVPDVLERIAGLPLSRLPELLPWNWRQSTISKPILTAA